MFESKGSDVYFDALHVEIFIQQNIMEDIDDILVKVLKLAGKCFSKTLAGKELKGQYT